MLTIFDRPLLLCHAELMSLTGKSLLVPLLAYSLVLDQDSLRLADLLSLQLDWFRRFIPVDLVSAYLMVPELLFDSIAFSVVSPWSTSIAISSDPSSPSALL